MPWDLIRQSKYKAILTFHHNYKIYDPYKITLLRALYSSVSLLRILRGVFLIPFSYLLLFFPPPPKLFIFCLLGRQRPPLPFSAKAYTVLVTKISFLIIFATRFSNADSSIFACDFIVCNFLPYIIMEWCYHNLAIWVQMRRLRPVKQLYRLLSFVIV